MLFSTPKKAIGLDIGTHSVKAIQMSRVAGRLHVDEAGYALVDRNMINADPVNAHAIAVREALQNMPLAQSIIVAALPGQTVVIRYPRLPESARDAMDDAVIREAGQNIPYDLNEVFLDWTLLTEIAEGDQIQLKVLLVAAKHEVIESRTQVLNAAEVQCSILSVDSLALSDAAESCDLLKQSETVALINVGLTSASIHFIKDGVSNFIRDVSWGSRELIQAIAKDRRCEYEEAQRLLQESSDEAGKKPEAPKPVAPPAAMKDDPFGEAPASASLLDPLDDELGSGGPVFGMEKEQRSVREVLAAPMARMVAEIRRSFDYYEHQLYEKPVDRLILSGGVAQLALIKDTLMEELSLERVEVANPANSALTLGEPAAVQALKQHSPQFMVAVGLAARGMVDL